MLAKESQEAHRRMHRNVPIITVMFYAIGMLVTTSLCQSVWCAPALCLQGTLLQSGNA